MAFKKRFILAQEAEERIVALYRREHGVFADAFNTAVDACQSIVLDMYDNSSADVVEVVRCKDCFLGRPIKFFDGRDMILCGFDNGSSRFPEFYCKAGKRKDGAE